MPAVQWAYDVARHVFVNTRTGKALTAREMVTIRDAFVASRQEYVRALVERYVAGALSQAELSAALRAATAETITALAVIGAGGVDRSGALGSAFLDVLESQLQRQVPFMDEFMAQVLADTVSPDQIANRAGMYQESAIQAYEQASAVDVGINLPYWPGDWQTECKAGCRCAWIIDTVYEGDDEVTYATWQTEEDGNVCDDCQARADDWQHVEVNRIAGAAPKVGTE